MLLLPIIHSCQTGSIKTDTDKEHLKGKVKSVTIIEYVGAAKAKYLNRQASDIFSTYIRRYNEQGNCLREEQIDNGIVSWTKYHKFDDAGKLTESTDTALGQIMNKELYTYDSQNRLVQRKSYINNEPADSTLYTYDKKGNNIEVDQYSASGRLKSKTHNKFDGAGNLILSELYNAKDGLVSRLKGLYNKSGHIEEHCLYNQLENCNYPEKVVMYFNIDNEEIARESYCKGESNAVKTTIAYTYDKQGNWIKETHLAADSIVEQYERKIEYY